MNHGLCDLSVVPLRKEPDDSSEMVSQLLFGEHFEIIQSKRQWKKIRIAFDQYEGWIDEKQFSPILLEDFNRLNKTASYVTTELIELVRYNDRLIPILAGSSLPFYNGQSFRIGSLSIPFDGKTKNCDHPVPGKKLAENACIYLNAPYLWGGRSPFGIDCSGFTQMVFKISGYRLKRDAWQQAEQGISVGLITEARTGDLAFFENPDGKIVHTGIILSPDEIIHASGKVRIDKVDQQGIFNVTRKRYTHNLRLIRRIL